jgi:general stress protein CsbA
MTELLAVGIAFGAALSIALIVVMMHHPKVWLGAVILLLPVFLADTGVGVSVSEALIGVFIIGSVIAWISVKLATGYKLIRGWPDMLLIAFILLSTVNVIIAAANEVDPLTWLLEWSLYIVLLYYFPFREYFGNSKTDLVQMLVLLGVSVLVMGAFTAKDYYTRSQDGMIYAYQILASRSRLFAPLFVFGGVVSLAMMFHVSTWRDRLAMAVLTMISVAGLLQSFTRSLWVIFIGCVIIVAFFLTLRQNLTMAATAVVGCIAAIVVAYAVNPLIANTLTTIVTKRFASSTQLKGGDYSFEVRLIEADMAMRDIRRYPLGGAGIQSMIVTWDPIAQHHNRTPFMHIGYISLVYKLGLALSLLMLSVLAVFTVQSFRLAINLRNRDNSDPILRATAVGVLAFQPALYTFIAVAGVFDQRYGNTMLVMSFALTGIISQLAPRMIPQRQASSPLPIAT